MEDGLIELTGIVESVLFKSDQGGYVVFDFNTGAELITVVGELGDIDENEKLKIRGTYKSHYKFGNQFRAEYVELIFPSISSEIRNYLSSGVIKGINKSLANKIVEEFGELTFEVIEREPSKLRRIKGSTPQIADNISNEVNKVFHLKILIGKLGELGIKPRYAMRIFKKWKFHSFEVINDNPYMICDEDIGIDFIKAEQIALEVGIALDSPKRIGAGLKYVLNVNAANGHTCLPLEQLEKLTCDYLVINSKQFYNAYNFEIEDSNIIEYEKKHRTFIYLSEYYSA